MNACDWSAMVMNLEADQLLYRGNHKAHVECMAKCEAMGGPSEAQKNCFLNCYKDMVAATPQETDLSKTFYHDWEINGVEVGPTSWCGSGGGHSCGCMY